jgi:hypothetical protein
MDIPLSYPPYTAKRSCFVKLFLKWFQLCYRIYFTSTATAGTTTAGTLTIHPKCVRVYSCGVGACFCKGHHKYADVHM